MSQEVHPQPITHEPPHWEGGINPAISVGDAMRTYEVRGEHGERLFCWEPTSADLEVAPIAGWNELPHKVNVIGGQLQIPETTRSAANVLASMAAWPTEKDEVLREMASYVNAVYGTFGKVDVSFSLDTVGVPRGREKMFMVPPHTLDDDQAIKKLWLDGVVHDLREVLSRDARGEELIQKFVADLHIGDK